MDSTLKICLKAVGFLILVAVIQAISLYIVGAVYAVSSDTSFEEVMNVISTKGWELANEVIIPFLAFCWQNGRPYQVIISQKSPISF